MVADPLLEVARLLRRIVRRRHGLDDRRLAAAIPAGQRHGGGDDPYDDGQCDRDRRRPEPERRALEASSFAAALRAPSSSPASSLDATRFASAASELPTRAEKLGPASPRLSAPQADRARALHAVLETSSQGLRQAALTNLLLGALDWIRDTVEGGPASVQVKRKPGSARVAVSRLAHRSRVQEPAPVREVDLLAGRGVVALDPFADQAVRQRDVAVPDQDDRRLGGFERGERDGG